METWRRRAYARSLRIWSSVSEIYVRIMSNMTTIRVMMM